MNTCPEGFDHFVRAMTKVVDTVGTNEPLILRSGRTLLQQLVAVDDWLPQEFARPHPTYYGQYLLHCDPHDRFCVVSFVWGPGQKTPIHNHTVWALIGMLRGAETSERFLHHGENAPMTATGVDLLTPGLIDQVSPEIGDIHRVSNAYEDRVSISIHAYGGNIGRIDRCVFDQQAGTTKAFVSGYTNSGGRTLTGQLVP